MNSIARLALIVALAALSGCFDAKKTDSAAPGASPTSIPVNAAPTIGGSPGTSATVGVRYTFQPSASDPNGDALTFSVSGLPSWASFDSASGTLSGTPTTAGMASGITISVSDGKASTALPSFSIMIAAAGNAPSISGNPPTTATVGTAYAFQPVASDPAGKSLTYSVTNRPAWASFSTSSGALTGTPSATGSFPGIVISVSDGTLTASLPAFTITVGAIAEIPPTISGTPPPTVVAGSAYAFTPSATGKSGAVLAFGVSNKPAWASFDTTTGRLSGTPTAANVGTYANIAIAVSDGVVNVNLPNFTITVTAPSTNGSATITWVAPTQNTDGTTLSNLSGYKIYYGTSVSTLGTVVAVNNASATTYTITGLSSGTYYVALSTLDSVGLESQQSNPASITVP